MTRKVTAPSSWARRSMLCCKGEVKNSGKRVTTSIRIGFYEARRRQNLDDALVQVDVDDHLLHRGKQHLPSVLLHHVDVVSRGGDDLRQLPQVSAVLGVPDSQTL